VIIHISYHLVYYKQAYIVYLLPNLHHHKVVSVIKRDHIKKTRNNLHWSIIYAYVGI